MSAKSVKSIVTNDDSTVQTFDSSAGTPPVIAPVVIKVEGASITIPLNVPIILVTDDVSPSPKGTVSVVAGSPTVTGVNTTFMTTVKVGNTITIGTETQIVTSIESDTSLTTGAWVTSVSAANYTVRVDNVGTISVTAGQPIVTGVNTAFLSQVKVGNRISSNGEVHTVSSVGSDTALMTDVWVTTTNGVIYVIGR